jgi:hypothetical protein
LSKPITLRKLISQELAYGEARSPKELATTLATPVRIICMKLTGMAKDGQLLVKGTPKLYKLNPAYVVPLTTQEIKNLAKKAKADNYAANAIKSTYQPDRMGTTYVPPKTEGVRNVRS